MIEHGRIVEEGSAAELLAQDGPFRRLAGTLHAPRIGDAHNPVRCLTDTGIGASVIWHG